MSECYNDNNKQLLHIDSNDKKCEQEWLNIAQKSFDNENEYKQDELRPGLAMLMKIVSDLKKKKNVEYMLPLNDENAMKDAIEPFATLTLVGTVFIQF